MTRYTLAKAIPLALLAGLISGISYCYRQRLETNIFRIDLYLLWVVAAVILMRSSISGSRSLNRLQMLMGVICFYIMMLCISQSFPDSNSINALLTLSACFLIIVYLQTLDNTSRYIIQVAFLLSFLCQTLIAYKHAFTHRFDSMSITGLLYNSGFFGNYLSCFIPFFFSALLSKPIYKWVRAGAIVLFVSSGVLLYLTMARAAWLGSMIGCLVVVAFSLRLKISKRSIIVLLLLGITAAVFCSKQIFQLKPQSALGRLTIYEVSGAIISDNLLFGLGPNRFAAAYNNYQSSYFQKKDRPIDIQLRAGDTFEAFNSIVQLLVEYGIGGVLLFATIIYFTIRHCELNKQNRINLGSLGCLVAIVVASLFSNPFHASPIVLVICFHLSVVPGKLRSNWLIPLKTIPTIAISFACSFLLIYYAVLRVRSEIKWARAATMAQVDAWDKARSLYAGAYPALKHNGDFLYNYGAEAYLNNDPDLAIKLLERSKRYCSFSNLFVYLGNAYADKNEFELAETNYLHGIFISPSRIYPKYQLVQLYRKWNKHQLSNAWAKKAIEYPIKVKTEAGEELRRELFRSLAR